MQEIHVYVILFWRVVTTSSSLWSINVWENISNKRYLHSVTLMNAQVLVNMLYTYEDACSWCDFVELNFFCKPWDTGRRHDAVRLFYELISLGRT